MSTALTVTAEPGTPFIDATREFDHPIAKLWRAFTEPELMARWIGPRQYRVEQVELDARAGGHYRYVHVGEQGQSFGFRGVIHSVEEQRSITQTFEFEGLPGHVSLERARFTDLGDGRTRLELHSVFQSVEDRDGIIASGMQAGMSESYDRLSELLSSL